MDDRRFGLLSSAGGASLISVSTWDEKERFRPGDIYDEGESDGCLLLDMAAPIAEMGGSRLSSPEDGCLVGKGRRDC